MPFAADWLYRRLGHRYFWAYVAFEAMSAYLTALGTLAIFALYTHVSAEDFWRAVVVSDLAVTAALIVAEKRAYRLAAPIVDWIRAGKPDSGALVVWRTAARLP